MGGAYWLVSLFLSAPTPPPPDPLPPPPGTRHLGLAAVTPPASTWKAAVCRVTPQYLLMGPPSPQSASRLSVRKKDGPQRTLGVSQQLIQVPPLLLLSLEEYTLLQVVAGGSRSLSLFKD